MCCSCFYVDEDRPFAILDLLTARDSRELLKGETIYAMTRLENDYHNDLLPFIPAGTEMRIDFGGDFGLYAFAAVGGVLHKVKIKLHELHLLDWNGLV